MTDGATVTRGSGNVFRDPDVRINCSSCGRFIPHADMNSGAAKFYFEPDSHKGPEICEWTCATCAIKELEK